MNRSRMLMIVVFMCLIPMIGVAQEPGAVKEAMPEIEKLMDKGIVGSKCHNKMCAMNRPGMPMVVATSDGGVVVITGNVMSKYDQDLDLVRQVQLKTAKPKGQCPMAVKDMPQEPKVEEKSTPEVLGEEQGPVQPIVETEPVKDVQPEVVAVPADVMDDSNKAADSVVEQTPVSVDEVVNEAAPMIDIQPAAKVPEAAVEMLNQTIDTVINEEK